MKSIKDHGIIKLSILHTTTYFKLIVSDASKIYIPLTFQKYWIFKRYTRNAEQTNCYKGSKWNIK